MCACEFVYVSAMFTEARRGWRIPGAGVTGRCEQPDEVDAGNQNQFLCKRIACMLTDKPSLQPQRQTCI